MALGCVCIGVGLECRVEGGYAFAGALTAYGIPIRGNSEIDVFTHFPSSRSVSTHLDSHKFTHARQDLGAKMMGT